MAGGGAADAQPADPGPGPDPGFRGTVTFKFHLKLPAHLDSESEVPDRTRPGTRTVPKKKVGGHRDAPGVTVTVTVTTAARPGVTVTPGHRPGSHVTRTLTVCQWAAAGVAPPPPPRVRAGLGAPLRALAP